MQKYIIFKRGDFFYEMEYSLSGYYERKDEILRSDDITTLNQVQEIIITSNRYCHDNVDSVYLMCQQPDGNYNRCPGASRFNTMADCELFLQNNELQLSANKPIFVKFGQYYYECIKENNYYVRNPNLIRKTAL